MNIKNQENNLNFGAKFIDNKAFREVVKYAKDSNQLMELDTALNKLNNVNKGDILIIHGKIPEGIYSNFNMGHRSVQNLGAETPEKATFNAILELGKLGKKFKKLFGEDAKLQLKEDDLISKYSVKN